ncbi:hypothetical protein UlMin_011057 [Ulmus minor]
MDQNENEAPSSLVDTNSNSSATPELPSDSDPCLSRNVSFSKLNAQAPEFVPSPRSDLHPIPPPPPPFHVPIRPHVPVLPSHAIPVHHHRHRHHHQVPLQYHPHSHHYYGADHDQPPQGSKPSDHSSSSSKNKLSDDNTLKILNQVEYYFSDLNLATTDHLIRFINKDPEGFVPISVVSSFKKIKALINSNAQLATVLRNSSKLVVSDDGKKVRRHVPFTQSDMEELQSRIIVAENLPEDHCHQNLMKIFSAVGSLKTIRTCQPQSSNGGASSASRSSKSDNMLFCNKLHAFVEYESVELAEKAVADLNDEGNWRSGLRVRLMVKRTSKHSQGWDKKGPDGDVQCEEDDTCVAEQSVDGKLSEDASQQADLHPYEQPGEEHGNEKEGVQRKGRNLRRNSKGRGRGQYHHNSRGNHFVGTPPSNNSISLEQQQQAAAGVAKQQPPGPRMPDGTRGFAMGRGKPIAVNNL